MLTIRHKRSFYEPRLPHLVFIDDLFAGVMRSDTLDIDVPPGAHNVRVQCGGRIPLGRSQRSIDLSVSGTYTFTMPRSAASSIHRHAASPIQHPSPTSTFTPSRPQETTIVFHDREKLWNILFDIDLIAWIVSLFVTFPPLYRIISDAFFLIWIIRLICIRKKYYRFNFITEPAND